MHTLTTESDNGQELLLVCPDCPRRLVLKRTGEMIVIDRGDFFVLHSGGVGPISMTMERTGT